MGYTMGWTLIKRWEEYGEEKAEIGIGYQSKITVSLYKEGGKWFVENIKFKAWNIGARAPQEWVMMNRWMGEFGGLRHGERIGIEEFIGEEEANRLGFLEKRVPPASRGRFYVGISFGFAPNEVKRVEEIQKWVVQVCCDCLSRFTCNLGGKEMRLLEWSTGSWPEKDGWELRVNLVLDGDEELMGVFVGLIEAAVGSPKTDAIVGGWWR